MTQIELQDAITTVKRAGVKTNNWLLLVSDAEWESVSALFSTMNEEAARPEAQTLKAKIDRSQITTIHPQKAPLLKSGFLLVPKPEAA